MFSYFRLAPRCVRTCPHLPSYRYAQRSISYTPVTRSDLSPEPPSEADLQVEGQDFEAIAEDTLESLRKGSKGESRQPETYKEFMEAAGENFRTPDAPNKWLGEEVPFPMNPTFRPPPPVSDIIRSAIYREYMENPEQNNVRALSRKFHLSLKRVDAILRLKGMEAHWVKDKPLQTGFRIGMERILGVSQRQVPDRVRPNETRSDAHEADMLEQEENRDAARQRYQQLYWESVPEDGREPIVPASLEHAKRLGKIFTERREAHKSNPQLMPRVDDSTTQSPHGKVQVVNKDGRPSLMFVDVGGHFIDVKERLKRVTESERRAQITARRADKRKKGEKVLTRVQIQADRVAKRKTARKLRRANRS